MPERDSPGQWGDTHQGDRPGEQAGTPSQGAMPGHEQFGSPPSGSSQGPQGGAPGGQWGGQDWGSQPGWISPVDRAETRVTGRRVVQYIIDAILVSIIPGIAFWLLDRGSGLAHALLWLVAVAIWVVVELYYWVLRPHNHTGQTYGMQLLGVRVISKDGGPASIAQLFIRAILLVIDTLFFCLVGFITILCSRYRQRVGDHAARTLVISTGYAVRSAPQFASSGTGQMGMGTGQQGTEPGRAG